MNAIVQDMDAPTVVREYLTCQLGAETYAIELIRVLEIRELQHITRVPNQDAFMRGVMNLRGAIVPVADLSAILGFPAQERSTEVMVVLSGENRQVGVVVDAVSDVITLASDQLQRTPEGLARAAGEVIEHVTRLEDGVGSVMILDIDKVLRRVRDAR